MTFLTDLFEGDAPVSQKFGARPEYYKKFGFNGHEGVDWATKVGTWVIVPFEKGQILRTGYDSAYGYYIVIWDAVQHHAVWYCHLSAIIASPGQVLPRGNRVGKTGNSGNSTGAHLHVNFVETDAKGNRLNYNNGYKGNLNILDPKLVTWGKPPEQLPKTDAEIVKYLKEQSSKFNDADFGSLARKVLNV